MNQYHQKGAKRNANRISTLYHRETQKSLQENALPAPGVCSQSVTTVLAFLTAAAARKVEMPPILRNKDIVNPQVLLLDGTCC